MDRTAGANAIRQQLDNLNEAGSLYGAIIYQKAPVVMRHLESLMGEDVFRDGLREYLKTYSFGNATWSDLIRILDARTPTDLVKWSHVWVEEPRRPEIYTTLDVKDGKISRLSFEQRDPARGNRQWPQELRLLIGYRDKTVPLTGVDLPARSVDVPAAVGMPAPLFVLPNGGGWAYGGFHLDRTSLDYLAHSLPELSDPLTRGAAWVTLWDACSITPSSRWTSCSSPATALPRETDEQLTQRVLGLSERRLVAAPDVRPSAKRARRTSRSS